MATRCAVFENLSLIQGSQLPASRIPGPFLYGCAWKKDKTADLVHEALKTGFRGIDVAAQPKHYREDLAGAGIRRASSESIIKREDIFIQTKYTPYGGQDPKNMPYDPQAPIAEQVRQSVNSSLRNLRWQDPVEGEQETYIDSLVLHSPLPTLEQTAEAWKACEEFVPDHIRNLGISNTTLPILEALYESATIKPSIVQNRFYRDTSYEVPLRRFCGEKGIIYQSFWSITANPDLLKSRVVLSLAKDASVEPAVALYGLILGLGNTVICNGTKSHMASDLEGIQRIRQFGTDNPYEWKNAMKGFKDVIGDNSPDAEMPV